MLLVTEATSHLLHYFLFVLISSLHISVGGSTREGSHFALPVFSLQLLILCPIQAYIRPVQECDWIWIQPTFDLPFTQPHKASKTLFAFFFCTLTIIFCEPGKV